MESYTIEQHVEIVKIHIENGEDFVEIFRNYQTDFGHRNAPCSNTGGVK